MISIICHECGDPALEIEAPLPYLLDGASIDAIECECSCGVAGTLRMHDDDEHQWLRFHPLTEETPLGFDPEDAEFSIGEL